MARDNYQVYCPHCGERIKRPANKEEKDRLRQLDRIVRDMSDPALDRMIELGKMLRSMHPNDVIKKESDADVRDVLDAVVRTVVTPKITDEIYNISPTLGSRIRSK